MTATNVKPAGTQESEVAALEARYSVKLPGAFRTYLLTTAPSDRWVHDADIVGWWNAGEIKSIRDEYEPTPLNTALAENPDTYLIFADHCMWCWAWAIDCGDGDHRGRIAVLNGLNDRFVANSFDAFIDLYIADPNTVA